MSLLKRSVTSSAYNVIANVISMGSSFVSAIILARLLEPEVFGVYAYAFSTVYLTQALSAFGFGGAFMFYTSGKRGITEGVLRTHFTLKLLFSVAWAILMVGGTRLFVTADSQWVFWIIIGAAFLTNLTGTANEILRRQVQFRRVALAQVLKAIVQDSLSILLAWRGFGLWALLIPLVVSAMVDVTIFYIIHPVWRPRLGWYPEIVRYFLTFGSKVFFGGILAQALDRVDDVWTGTVLGERALGFYSRAYRFATYPRQIIVAPLSQVVSGTYAQLRDDRLHLSQAFNWVNLLTIRANFWIAGLLWLVAPEFIQLVIGPKWLPMLDTFRMMLLYTLFDPIKTMVASVISLSGVPERVIRIRIIQLLVMVVGLLTLGPWLGIVGVAIAVDIMLVLGILMLYAEARNFVDFSLKHLFGAPILALGVGVVAVYGALSLLRETDADWRTAFVKVCVFSLLYAGIWILLERDKIPVLIKVGRQLISSKKRQIFAS